MGPDVMCVHVSIALLQCAAAVASSSTVDGSQLRMIRSIKPLRWFKIARFTSFWPPGCLAVLSIDSLLRDGASGPSGCIVKIDVAGSLMISLGVW